MLRLFSLVLQIRVRKIAPKIVQLLTEWTETFPYDFRDDRMMRGLKELTHRLTFGDEVSYHAVPEQGVIHYFLPAASRGVEIPCIVFEESPMRLEMSKELDDLVVLLGIMSLTLEIC